MFKLMIWTVQMSFWTLKLLVPATIWTCRMLWQAGVLTVAAIGAVAVAAKSAGERKSLPRL